jgi:hypothetical protein
VTVEVDYPRQITEAREDNNLLSASLTPRLAISQEVRPTETPARGLTPSEQKGKPQVEIERVYVKDGRVHVLLKNAGVALSNDDLRKISLNLQVGNRSSSWCLGEIDPRLQLAQGQGTLEFDTGITPQEGTDIKVYTKGKGWQLAPMTAVGIPRGAELLRRARDVFGEDNDTLEGAYQLQPRQVVGRRYEAALSLEDVDYYRFTVPNSGLGSWVQITAQSVNPAAGRLYVWLLGPQGSGWEETGHTTNGKIWVAAKAGLTLYLEVTPDSNQLQDLGAAVLDYDITLLYGVIPDADTSMGDHDYQRATAEIRLNQPRQAYMASVGDENFDEIGLWDWWVYRDYQPCRNYCVRLSRPGLIVQQNPDGASFPDGGETSRYCLNDNDGRADGNPPLWVGVTYQGEGAWSFVGIGDVPQRCKVPYTVTLTEEGAASNTMGCEP